MSLIQIAALASLEMAPGMNAYHTFLLIEACEGCRIVTEGVLKGPGAVESRRKPPSAMREGNGLWLRALKQCPEQ
jgi:hypothetical protein